MTYHINHQPHSSRATTLQALAQELQLPQAGVAVGLNGRMVPRALWPDTPLADGAAITIVKAACGG